MSSESITEESGEGNCGEMSRGLQLAAFIGIAERQCETDINLGGVVYKGTFHAYVDAVDEFMRHVDETDEEREGG